MSATLEMAFNEIPAGFQTTSAGKPLSHDVDKFGVLRDSSDIAFDGAALRERMETDGYLFLPGLLSRDEVFAARREAANWLMENGKLQPGTDPMECIAHPDVRTAFEPGAARENRALMKVLYEGAMMDFYARFLDGEVRHFDYTWFRAVSPGGSTLPHTDAVYMNRGTQNLYTSWTPIGDVSRELGGLMILEGSHKHQKLRENYSQMDVDAVCENKRDEAGKPLSAMGKLRPGGWLTQDPVKLRDALGGRWLTSEFRAGDLLMFSIFTVHASIDNQTDRIRLSSDSRYQRASEAVDERWIGENPPAHGPNAKRGMIC